MHRLWLSRRLINSANLQFELDLLDGRNEIKRSKFNFVRFLVEDIGLFLSST
jgi:hypothetical protein